MNTKIRLGLVVLAAMLGFTSLALAAPVDWVNTYIGTGGSANGPDYGGTMPLVTAPVGVAPEGTVAPVTIRGCRSGG